MKKLIALLALLVAAAGVHACPHTVQQVVVKKRAVVVAQPVVAAVVAPVLVPTYTAAYYAPSDQSEVVKELRALRAELAALKGGATGEVLSLQALVAGKCASCHQPKNAEARGGGQVLIEDDGKLPPFSLAEKKAIIRAVESGEMPPRSPLAAHEKAALKAALTRRE